MTLIFSLSPWPLCTLLGVFNLCLAGFIGTRWTRLRLKQCIPVTYFKPRYGDAFNVLTYEAFDIVECAFFFAADKGNGLSFVSGTGSTAYTVDVVFCQVGEV